MDLDTEKEEVGPRLRYRVVLAREGFIDAGLLSLHSVMCNIGDGRVRLFARILQVLTHVGSLPPPTNDVRIYNHAHTHAHTGHSSTPKTHS